MYAPGASGRASSKRRFKPESAGSALIPILKELGLGDAMALKKLQDSWQGLAGEPISLHTFPITLKKGCLFVNVDTPVWLQEVGYLRGGLLGKLRAHGVRDLKLRLGRVSQGPSSATAPPPGQGVRHRPRRGGPPRGTGLGTRGRGT